jgi:hypothetical protein
MTVGTRYYSPTGGMKQHSCTGSDSELPRRQGGRVHTINCGLDLHGCCSRRGVRNLVRRAGGAQRRCDNNFASAARTRVGRMTRLTVPGTFSRNGQPDNPKLGRLQLRCKSEQGQATPDAPQVALR